MIIMMSVSVWEVFPYYTCRKTDHSKADDDICDVHSVIVDFVTLGMRLEGSCSDMHQSLGFFLVAVLAVRAICLFLLPATGSSCLLLRRTPGNFTPCDLKHCLLFPTPNAIEQEYLNVL